MRELKFRVWDKNYKKLFYINFTIQAAFVLESDVSKIKQLSMIVSDDIDIMQYINEKDANGREIYEGDIVSLDNTFVGVVEYDNAMCGYFIKGKDNFDSYWKFTSILNLLIEGNIYENPELLEEN